MKIAFRASRPVLVLAASLALCPLAPSQVTLLANGQPQGTPVNGDVVSVQGGTVLTLLIQAPNSAGSAYGLFGAYGDNASTSGWFLAASGGTDPFPLVTGVGTIKLENYLATQGVNVTIAPARGGSPVYRLNSTGERTLRFNVPTGMTGQIILQAAVQLPGSLNFEISNAVVIDMSPSTPAAKLLFASDFGAGDPNAMQLGVLEYAGNPNTPGITIEFSNLAIDPIALSCFPDWEAHDDARGDGSALPRDIDVYRNDAPSLNGLNSEFPRLALPAAAGPDGLFETADDVPPRELLCCYDNATDEGFYLVVNKGDNPNAGGAGFLEIAGTRQQLAAGTGNGWSSVCGANADGTVVAVVFEEDPGTGPEHRIYLIAADGRTPFIVAGSPAAAVDITPSGVGETSTTIHPRSILFGATHVYFVMDDGTDGDSDGFSERLFSADWTAAQPAPFEVVVPPTTIGGSTVDIFAHSSFLASESGDRIVFLAGDVFDDDEGDVQHLRKADWHALSDGGAIALNFTQFTQTRFESNPKMLIPRDAYNGRAGWASLSPDGTMLAFVSYNNEEFEEEDDDEVYVAPTDGSATPGLISNMVTNLLFFASDDLPRLDNAGDVRMIDSDRLLFWYGKIRGTGNPHVGDLEYDLFHYVISTETMENVTKTGDFVFPIATAVATIYPEGTFFSPNRRYYYFLRGLIDEEESNLVGVDLEGGLQVFNVTGDEFSGTPADSTERLGDFAENRAWQLHYAGGDFPAQVYFAAAAPALSSGQQVWTYDADFPTAAIRLTSTAIAGRTVEGLTADPHALATAWHWSEGGDTSLGELWLFDGQRGVLSVQNGSLAVGSLVFVPGRAADATREGVAPALVAALGFAGVGPGENPADGLLFYIPLDSTRPFDGIQPMVNGAPGSTLQIFHASID